MNPKFKVTAQLPLAADSAEDKCKILLARQPIVDKKQRLVAYELLFRAANTSFSGAPEAMHATRTVLNNAFNTIGIATVLGTARGYINVDSRFLLSDLVIQLPPEQVVLEILESVDPTAELIARVKELKKHGYSFALDDYLGDPEKIGPLIDEVDIVKVDLLGIDPARLREITTDLRRRHVQVIAEKVENKLAFDRTRRLGVDLFQGYYLAPPQLLTSGNENSRSDLLLLTLPALLFDNSPTTK
jgi:EAL and modified HD-GYP domain-containing signal transduction protein